MKLYYGWIKLLTQAYLFHQIDQPVERKKEGKIELTKFGPPDSLPPNIVISQRNNLKHIGDNNQRPTHVVYSRISS